MKVQDKVVPISHRQENEKQVTLPMKVIAHKHNRIFETVKNLTWEKTINNVKFNQSLFITVV